ncbi:alpha/beta hydrolase [Streptomyces sp. BH-SS-21]|uniref:Alpha/beta hydrolase n=1 Tax=Streptomyces liliiviolaceus TaxID=2823109 RepID=A0A940XTT9_9ACTN|nr:alpha/beta hydrolase [Streptomyces liliiviolaceus]
MALPERRARSSTSWHRDPQSPRLRRITAPTLVVHGAEDPLIPVACGRDAADNIAGVELLIIPGMGHHSPRPRRCSLSSRMRSKG